MKTRSTFFLLSFAIIGMILVSGRSFAQTNTDDTKSKKTYTIHVTKEVDGNTVVIDTTVVTDGEFDADAFLIEKGVMDNVPGSEKKVDKHVIIRHPGSKEITWSESDGKSPDTIIIKDDQVFVFNDNFEMPSQLPPMKGMQFDYDFEMPQDFPHFDGQQFEDMMEGMARSFGLENVMPFGEMKQVVVKKKRNGKKVIITFEDRDEKAPSKQKEEKVIIYKNSDQIMAPENEEQIILDSESGERIIIRKEIRKTDNGTEVIVNTTVDKPDPDKKERKVIIIEEEKK